MTSALSFISIFFRTAQLTIPGVFGAVTVLMALYKDDTFTEQITDANSDLSIDSYVYVGFNIPSLQASTFSIKVISIQASTLENSGDVYNLTKGPDGYADILQFFVTIILF